MKSTIFRTTTVAIFLAGLMVTGCSQAATDPSPPPDVQWGACPEGVENPDDGPARLQCAAVPVPLNYDEPDGERIDITISRLASRNPDKSRGVLFLNPGGPGGSGLDQPNFLVERGMPQDVLDSYDLIGMDTRGIGHSSPISCGFTDDVAYRGAVPPYAYDDAAFGEQTAIAEEVAHRCAAGDDGRLSQVTTANMSRDLDRIRSTLGEDKASFLGYSYGTALGAAYASMYPDTTDRVVLDSNIGDTHLDQDGMRSYAEGMEQTFPDFAKWAAVRNDRYGLGATEQEVRDSYFRIADRLDRNPVDGMDGRTFRLATFVTLYNPGSYESAADTWRHVLDTPDVPTPPTPVGNAPSAMDNNWSVFLAVTCNDVEWPHGADAYRQSIAEDREKHPLFGAAAANVMPCAYWQHEPSEPPVAVNDDGPTNVLVVQHDRDPVTPLRGGRLIDEKFGDRSRLISVDGSGHGVFVLGKNECADAAVADFLVDGVMPEQDATC